MYRTPEMLDLYQNFPINEALDIWVSLDQNFPINEALDIWINLDRNFPINQAQSCFNIKGLTILLVLFS